MLYKIIIIYSDVYVFIPWRLFHHIIKKYILINIVISRNSNIFKNIFILFFFLIRIHGFIRIILMIWIIIFNFININFFQICYFFFNIRRSLINYITYFISIIRIICIITGISIAIIISIIVIIILFIFFFIFLIFFVFFLFFFIFFFLFLIFLRFSAFNSQKKLESWKWVRFFCICFFEAFVFIKSFIPNNQIRNC